MKACAECAIVRGDVRSRSLATVDRGLFVVHPKPEDAPVAGWFILAPKRHVEQIDDLEPEELAALGPLTAEVGAAVRAITGCEKLYVTIFAELLPHLHVHVIPRLPGAETLGPRIFLADTIAPRIDEVARAVVARLTGSA